MFHTVYITTNLINGKFYIGKHSTLDPNDRYLGSGKVLGAAIAKYGIEHFAKEILEVFEKEEDAYDFEREVISAYDGVTNPMCYNMCYGGVGFWKGSTHSDESRKKISDGNKGKVISEQQKQRLRDINLGKVLSEETKQRIRNKRKLQIVTQEQRDKNSLAHKGKKRAEHTKVNFKAGAKKRIESGVAMPNPKGSIRSQDTRDRISASLKALGMKRTDEQREHLKTFIGEKNSQHGSRWVNNGLTSKKISNTMQIEAGWGYGRLGNGQKSRTNEDV